MKKLFTTLFSLLLLPSVVFATNALQNMEKVGTKGGYLEATEITLAARIGFIINVFFSLLGIIFIVILLLAGYHYMMAQGDTTKTKTALASIRHAVIGLILTVGAYAIWIFIFSSLNF